VAAFFFSSLVRASCLSDLTSPFRAYSASFECPSLSLFWTPRFSSLIMGLLLFYFSAHRTRSTSGRDPLFTTAFLFFAPFGDRPRNLFFPGHLPFSMFPPPKPRFPKPAKRPFSFLPRRSSPSFSKWHLRPAVFSVLAFFLLGPPPTLPRCLLGMSPPSAGNTVRRTVASVSVSHCDALLGVCRVCVPFRIST